MGDDDQDPAPIEPIDAIDPVLSVAKAVMRDAQATSLAGIGASTYWLVDTAARDPVDMVCVVDLKAIGNIAKGMGADWAGKATSMRLYPVGSECSTRDVLDALVHRISGVRMGSASTKPH